MKLSEETIQSLTTDVNAVFYVIKGDVDYGMCDVVPMSIKIISTEGENSAVRYAKIHGPIMIHV